MNDLLIWIRFVHFGATVATVGALGFPWLLKGVAGTDRSSTQAVRRTFDARMAALAWSGLGLTLISGAAWLVQEAVNMSGQPLARVLTTGILGVMWTQTRFGAECQWRLAACLLTGATFVLSRRSRARHSTLLEGATLGFAVTLVGSLALSGHANAGTGSMGVLHLSSDIAHILGSAAWLGSLLPLALLLRTVRHSPDAHALALARCVTRRFSILGIASVGTLVVTGTVNAYFFVSGWAALVGTEYGRLLLAKVALFASMVVLAAINRVYLTPRMSRAPEWASESPCMCAVRQIERNALLEAALGFAIIAIVGALGVTPPPIHMRHM